MEKGHISITVNSVNYPLLVDLRTYGEVDIVDFAPGAIAGSPAWSELGLYLDVGQDNFRHGFGTHTFSEPASYAYSGSGVDTRHEFAGLFTTPGTALDLLTSSSARRLLVHRSIPTLLTSNYLWLKLGSTWWTVYTPGTTLYDMIDTGEYVVSTNSSRMALMDFGTSTTISGTTVTNSGAAWDTNVFAAGACYCYNPTTGLVGYGTVESNTATAITVSSWTGTQPVTGNVYFVTVVTGDGTNQPLNFGRLAVFGGYYWSYENNSNRLHFWSNASGTDAEGGTADAAKVVVGPSGGRIVNIFPYNNMLWVAREDALYNIGEDNLSYYMMGFHDEINSSNFATVVSWQGFLHFAVRNTLFRYKSGLQDITPPRWDDTIPYKQFGNFKGLCVRGEWLYVLGQSNAANTTEESGETAGFVTLLATNGVGWHKLWDIPLTAPTDYGIFLDPVNDILYVWAKPASGNSMMYPFTLQTYSDLPYASFPTTGTQYLYTSYYDLGYKRIQKSFASLTLRADYPTNTSISVSFRTDTNTSWTTLGTFTADMQEVDFPAATTGRRVQFRIRLVTASSSVSPILKGLIMKLMLRPDVLYGVNCRVLVQSSLSDQHQQPIPLTASEIRTALKAARSSVSPITLTDIHGTSASAYLASVRFQIVQYQDIDAWDEVAQCTFVYV